MSYQALLFCPDEKTARVVTQVLSELEFAVEPGNELYAVVKRLMAQHFDAIVVDCDNEQNASLLFKTARDSGSNQNALSVALVEGQSGVAKAFRIGANLVLTKPINVEQSKGTLRVARGLLRKAATSSAPSVAPSSFATAAAASSSGSAVQASSSRVATPPPTVANAAGLESEKEPLPAPEPADAALLDSMPISVTPGSKKTSPGLNIAGKVDSPWGPATKVAEPMASALHHAAEATGASIPGSVTLSASSEDSSAVRRDTSSRSFQTAADSSHESAGAMVAPISVNSFVINKDKSTSKNTEPIPVDAPAVPSPTFATLAVKDHEAHPVAGNSRKTLFLILLLFALAGAAYYGYLRLYGPATGGLGHPTVQPRTPAATPAPSSASPATAAAPAQPPAATLTPTPETLAGKASPATGNASSHAKPTPEILTADTARPKVAPITEITITPVNENKSTPANDTAEPIVVPSSPAPHPAVESPQPTPAAPPVVAEASNSETKLVGIVNGTHAVPAAPHQALRVSQGVSQGLLVHRVQPVYPQAAMQAGLQGTVLMEATIGKDGSVSSVKVIKGDPVLARAAVNAVRQWKYKPYLLNGEPVGIQTQITVNFVP
jgi:periplasmic protein TonB